MTSELKRRHLIIAYNTRSLEGSQQIQFEARFELSRVEEEVRV